MTKEEVQKCLEAYSKALSSMEADQWVGNFAEDGTVEDPVGTPMAKGKEQLRAFFETASQAFKKLQINFEFSVIIPPEAVAKFTVNAVAANDKEVSFEGITHYVYTEDGKIAQMRAFWDAEAVAKQLG